MPTIEQIKQLREETGVSFTECQKALRETNGDIDKAKEALRKMGREVAGKRMEKETKSGLINTYLHQNEKVGVMIEIRCESDFVAKSEDFKKLAHELCLQIAAMGEEIPILEQTWIKDDTKTVKELIDEYVAKIGEKVVVKKFIRYEI